MSVGVEEWRSAYSATKDPYSAVATRRLTPCDSMTCLRICPLAIAVHTACTAASRARCRDRAEIHASCAPCLRPAARLCP